MFSIKIFPSVPVSQSPGEISIVYQELWSDTQKVSLADFGTASGR
jgi:hypothetical protein